MHIELMKRPIYMKYVHNQQYESIQNYFFLIVLSIALPLVGINCRYHK